MEVCAGFYLLGKYFIEIISNERISGSFKLGQLDPRSQMVEYRVRSGCVLARSTQRSDRGPVGACADEDSVDILSSNLSIVR